jgi:uncharacterized protein
MQNKVLSLRIWVDADACPNPIKEILFRVAKRLSIETTLVANQPLQIPASPYIKSIQVRSGFDVADGYIVQALQVGDLVITADIPLAAEAIAKGAVALNPRGEFYSTDNIRERLSLRNFMVKPLPTNLIAFWQNFNPPWHDCECVEMHQSFTRVRRSRSLYSSRHQVTMLKSFIRIYPSSLC